MQGPSVKERVLRILEQHREKGFSGQELAAELGVSRAAVWKAVESLRKSGYEIEGTTNRGYRMKEEADVLSREAVMAYLPPEAAAFYRVECFDTVASTNDLLKEKASEGAAEGLVCIAEKQTAGKGRSGRSFYSPKGSGLYMSILFRPSCSAEEAVSITAAAAAAGARALEQCSDALFEGDIGIKWVNDLYYRHRKVCGILTEGMLSMETGRLDHAVLGMGFNLSEPEGGWPEEIRGIAGGLSGGITRSRLAAAVLAELLPLYRSLTERSFLPEYTKRQIVLGKEVEVYGGTAEPRRAVAYGVDGECHLLVRYTDTGEEAALSSGEVRIRPGDPDARF